jgi:hypothetical protein
MGTWDSMLILGWVLGSVASQLSPAASLHPQSGIDNETVRSIGQSAVAVLVALIGAGVALFVSVNNSRTARQLELDKRDHTEAGLRRKLNFLLKSTSVKLLSYLGSFAGDPGAWPQVIEELRMFVMTPELAAAVRSDMQMEAVYELVDSLAEAHRRAALYANMKQTELDEMYGDIPEAERHGIWDGYTMAVVMRYFLAPANAMQSYWSLVGNDELVKAFRGGITRAEEEMERQIARRTKPHPPPPPP